MREGIPREVTLAPRMTEVEVTSVYVGDITVGTAFVRQVFVTVSQVVPAGQQAAPLNHGITVPSHSRPGSHEASVPLPSQSGQRHPSPVSQIPSLSQTTVLPH